MYVEEFTIENIKGFEKIKLEMVDKKKNPAPWITLLGENGGGKSTVLQALGLLLAGPENVNKLLPVPYGWVRKEGTPGKLTIRIHQGKNDPGTFGQKMESKSFGYTYYVTGSEKVTVRNKQYNEPAIFENSEKRLTWLKENALTSKGKGWFAAGYGAFRRLTRESRVIVPTLTSQERHNNFTTQFKEDEALSSFEQWMIYLDYRIVKGDNGSKAFAEKQRDIAVQAINTILPEGVSYDSVSADGKILFDVKGIKVSTISLSDGYRSVLALIGDVIWRMLDHFPESADPLKEEGVVLIDELDIHLHPVWQREIAGLLRDQFPNIQFIVATHSPLIAAGAGTDAKTFRFVFHGDKTEVKEVADTAFMSVDRLLASSAFGLVSPFSPQTERYLQKFKMLKMKSNLTSQEKTELATVSPIAKKAYESFGDTSSLQVRIEQFLDEKFNDKG